MATLKAVETQSAYEIPDTYPAPTAEPVTHKSGIVVTELPDYSLKLDIPDSLIRGGTIVILRDPSQAEMEFVEQQLAKCPTRLEAIARLVCRLCTQWGDRPAITLPEWQKLRGKVAMAVIEIVGEFFLGGKPEAE